jgi:magnesium-transporting ATPase (P-type)
VTTSSAPGEPSSPSDASLARSTPTTGLTADEARRRLATDGPNVLPEEAPPPWWHSLLGQLTHFFARLLWIAGALAFVAGLPQLGAAIYVVVVINGVFAFVQERRAERAAQALRELLPATAVVLREGRPRRIDATELVVGDLVVLDAGDRVSADLEVREAHELRIDTSTFTGESVTATPGRGEAVHAGTFVVEGEGRAVVVAAGARTRLAGVASLARSAPRPRTPLAIELGRLVSTIARIAVAVGVVFFGLALLLGTPAQDGFLFAVGVTVALVPEGMLPTVTLSLAIGAQRMAEERALVRRLESVETLGSTTFICTDKTGTLTLNQMQVAAAWVPGVGTVAVEARGYDPEDGALEPSVAASLLPLARAARLASTGHVHRDDGTWRPEGDPIDVAVDVLGRRAARATRAGSAVPAPQRVVPFDARRRRRGVVVDGALFVKGAPEVVVARCAGGVDGAEEALERLTGDGFRVIAVAMRRDLGEQWATADADRLETGMELLGLLGLEDPPRPAARAAVEACRRAGIRVAMLTGDHPSTALAIAREVGLALADSPVMTADELPGEDHPNADELLGAVIDRDGIVIARVTPEDKLRIARALQSRGHVVAMTGDGVNDAPALSQADIGVAMGRSGTDVAREAADLVLLDDDFSTIVDAVAHGRATFANVRRFLTYHLTDNVAELTPFVVWALSGSRIPLALGVLQILFLDIGTDLLPALALGAERPSEHVLERPPARGRLLDRTVLTRAFGVLGPTEAVFEMLAFFAVFLAAGWRPGDAFPTDATLLAASGAAFTTVVVAQLANALACRSTVRPVWRSRFRGNRLLPWALGVEVVALGLFLFVPPVAGLLDQAPPGPAGWAVALLAIPALIVVDGLWKSGHLHRLLRRSFDQTSGATGR